MRYGKRISKIRDSHASCTVIDKWSYADKRRRPLEFGVGDKVMLKVALWKGVMRFGKRGNSRAKWVFALEEIATEFNLTTILLSRHLSSSLRPRTKRFCSCGFKDQGLLPHRAQLAAATVAAACASVRQWLAATVAAAWWRVVRHWWFLTNQLPLLCS
ncbi:hypothetical protein Tco_1309873 [Tanacetum coccineum]